MISRFVIRDLRFPALVALLLAVSPATGSARLWLSALLGIAGGAVVLALRVRRRRREGVLPAPVRNATAASAATPSRPEPLVLASLLLVAVAFAPALAWLFAESTDTQWRNVHGVFVPLFVFLLARSALRRDTAPSRSEASPWGLLLLIAGLGLAVLDAGVRSHYLAAAGLVLCLPGLSLLFLGARRTRLLAAPLALCVFALPAPTALEDPLGLNGLSAALADRVLDAWDVMVLRHRTVFITRNGPLNVSQNCSGLATLHAAAALSFVLAYTARSLPRRIGIPLLVFPLTALTNALRLVGIVVITDRAGMGFLKTPLHGLSGLLVLWFVLACLWLCADHRGLRESLS